ncbi:MAG: MlaD family protein [Proteobacteria bacterium]|nr:MlaD family protein [Pseudomonadota bacterium]
MNKNRISSELKVGILVIIGIIILFYMSFRVGKFGVFREKGYDLTVSLNNAAGINPKSPVHIAGVEVGKVRRITLDGYKASATLIIRDGVYIPADSKIVVRTQGILGDKYLEITPGVDKKFLAKGERIKEVVTSPDFDEIFTSLNSAAKNFGETMGEFKGIIGEKEKVNIQKSIDNIKVVSGDFKDLISGNKDNINRIVSSATLFSDRLGTMADKADETLSGLKNIVKDVEGGKGTLGLLVKDDKLYKDAKDTVASLKSISSDIDQGKGTIGKLVKDDSIYTDAKESMKNIKEITEGVRKGEGTLGKLVKDDSLYVESEKTMKKLQKAAEGLQEEVPITILGAILGIFF